MVTSAISRLHVVPLVTAGVVTLGAASGAVLGARIALSTSEERLRELYMASLLLLGGRSFVSAGHNLRSMWARRAL